MQFNPLTSPFKQDAIHGALRHVSNPLLLRFSERKLLLAFFDVLLLNTALFITLNARGELALSIQNAGVKSLWYLTLTLLWLVCAAVCGCYNLGRAASLRHSLAASCSAVLVTWTGYLMTPFITPTLPTTRLDVLAFPVLGMMAVGLWRASYAKVFVSPLFHQRALVVGAGWAGQTLAGALDELHHGVSVPHVGYEILGFIDDDTSKTGNYIGGRPVLGTRHDLVRLARDLKPHEIVVAITHSETIHPQLFEAILECREIGADVITMAHSYEQLSGRVPVEHAGRVLSVALPEQKAATHRFYAATQRLFDIGISLLGCCLLALVIPFVWLGNRISSPGPLFYTQERVGKGRRLFNILKFRSMVTDAEQHSGAVWASENDPRVTKFGRFLRKTRLDEIPQFLNVLRGEMSLIGPRPERPCFTDSLAQQIPFYRVRHAVRPGLTGWAQVKYRYGASEEDALVKLQYDLYYIKHQSVLLDLEILLRTVWVVLGFKGR